jgi:competence protein ComEA
LIFRSLIPLRFVRAALIGAAIVWPPLADFGARDDWTMLENCHFIVNPADDGDSFHVSVGTREYLFRLYMVDAPETDARTPARLIEQAKYFQITVPQAIEVGRAAKEFTQEKLSHPFTVFTRMSDAMGQSRIERFYAFVQTKDGDLGEQLVRNGLARNYGFKAAPPGLKNSRVELEKLQQLEDQARQEKIGGWGANAGRLSARLQKPASFSVFVAAKNSRPHAARLANSPLPISAIPAPSPVIATAKTVEPKKSRAKAAPELGRIDVNTATEKELRSVPGVGPVIAARIIAARPFRSADDLKKVNGIGDKNYTKIRPYFQ